MNLPQPQDQMWGHSGSEIYRAFAGDAARCAGFVGRVYQYFVATADREQSDLCRQLVDVDFTDETWARAAVCDAAVKLPKDQRAELAASVLAAI